MPAPGPAPTPPPAAVLARVARLLHRSLIPPAPVRSLEADCATFALWALGVISAAEAIDCLTTPAGRTVASAIHDAERGG